jgi:ATP-dependent helicase HrpB
MASIVEREWLRPTSTRVEHEFDDASGAVRAFGRDYYGAFVLRERHVDADPDEAARMLADAYRARPRQDAEVQLERRLRFAGIDVSFDSLVRDAAYGKRNVKDIDVYEALPWTVRQQLERDAPERIPVPSGRTAALVYEDDGSVSAEVKLQELFGLPETPRVGPRAEPVLLSLLAPNGRPVQMTRDLRSFWERTYPEVRKELRGRYPRHPWPEDPWTAAPTARTKRRQTGSN